ncbi:MAG: hypothetical protein J6V34_01130 [Oscillospiraceae bacterium]|nr:hypothetical protein [Oscillospiraceae bacterium]
MKLRTSFFDKTVLKKDLTRFFPLWALYLIGGLLMMHTASGFYDVYYGTQAYRLARNLNDIIGPMGIFSGIYGFLCAQLVFGDLHNTRLCYGLHALPLRRESWYVSHVTSGLWMGLAPTLVIALTLMPFMGKFWFMGLLCFGGIALHYLFFFALAAVCMMATGNRFAATAIYGLVNFLALIVNWFVNTIYLPLLPGVRNNTSVFHYFCPLVNLSGLDDFFTVHHPSTCPCNDVKYPTSYYFEYDGPHDYVFQGLGGQWWYLWILAGIGIVLLALGLVLYRRRDLERAGDFMAFKPMKPIFLTIYSLCLGAFLFMLGEAMGDNSTGFVFFVIGTAIGHFTGKMLLERTIRVFGRKSFAGMGLLYGAVILSLLLTWVDPVGISRRVPKAERVEKVYLYEGRLSDYQLNLNHISWEPEIEVTDPADIANICDIHRLMMEENKHSDNHDGGYFTILYKLKNGNTVSRTYRIYYNGQARSRLQQYLLNPEYLLGAASVENLIYQIDYLFLDGIDKLPEEMYGSLLNALWADALEGYIYRSPEFFDKYLDVGVIEYRLTNYQYRVLYFSKDAPHLNQWIEEYKAMNPLQT